MVEISIDVWNQEYRKEIFLKKKKKSFFLNTN